MATRREIILVHYSEIGLKGRNQPQFRRQLRCNLKQALEQQGIRWPVQQAHGYYVVAVPQEESDRAPLALRVLRDVCGVAWLTAARQVPRLPGVPVRSAADLEGTISELLAVADAAYAAGRSFRVRVTRADKSIPVTSPELESQMGEIIRAKTAWGTVCLGRPDVTFHVDITRDHSVVYSDRLRGPGGLPVGSSGRVLLLLSGGIDSPVAAYQMAKRGCRLDFIHFTAGFTSLEEARQSKIWRIAQRLCRFTLGSRLYLAPYTYFDLALLGKKADYQLILFRRFMARVAEQLAHQLGAEALVSGDNLSQVASQTLSNLVAASQATSMPIFRPLLGWNKEEIVQAAREIGTYEESIAPYKDCCALISQNPRTRSRHDMLTSEETRLLPDYQKCVERTLNETICLDVSPEVVAS